MSKIMKGLSFMRIPFTFITLLATFTVLAQENGSPFQFKKPEPPATQAVVTAVPEDADLTAKQRETVSSMISSFADTLKIDPEKNVPFEVDGRRYLLLHQGQAYLGVVNGQHVVFDEVSKEYGYHNALDISKIIRGDEFARMKEDALLELEKLQQSLMGGVDNGGAPLPGKPGELPNQPVINTDTHKGIKASDKTTQPRPVQVQEKKPVKVN